MRTGLQMPTSLPSPLASISVCSRGTLAGLPRGTGRVDAVLVDDAFGAWGGASGVPQAASARPAEVSPASLRKSRRVGSRLISSSVRLAGKKAWVYLGT